MGKMEQNTTPKRIVLTYEGKDYTLEFTRRVVCDMERNGFVFSKEELEKQPMTMFYALFHGAFKANHSGINEELIDEMFEKAADGELLKLLFEMYAVPYTVLTDESTPKGEKAWRVGA